PRPRSIGDLRQRRTFRRNERPVGLIFGALLDPALEQFLLGGGELLVAGGRRHHVPRPRRQDAADEGTRQVAGDDGTAARLGRLQRLLANVEAQTGLALFRVGTMTLEAVIREDGPDVAVVLDGRPLRDGCGPWTQPAGHGEKKHERHWPATGAARRGHRDGSRWRRV